MSAGELFTDSDLSRRLTARRSTDSSERYRLRCRRCHKAIPNTRRSTALYCSVTCQRAYRWEKITALRTEMRGEFRRLSSRKACVCGEPIPEQQRLGRRGLLVQYCSKRCRDRLAQRQRRQRLKDAVKG